MKDQCRRFEKSWMSPMFITKTWLLGSLTLIALIKKRTPDFLGEIRAMIDKDPRQFIKSISRDMEVSEFIIRQVVHEDICYFSNKMRKGRFLSVVTLQKVTQSQIIKMEVGNEMEIFITLTKYNTLKRSEEGNSQVVVTI